MKSSPTPPPSPTSASTTDDPAAELVRVGGPLEDLPTRAGWSGRRSCGCRRSADHGRIFDEITAYLNTGIDGFFTDQADIGVLARDTFVHPS
jgi:hypothetical protein